MSKKTKEVSETDIFEDALISAAANLALHYTRVICERALAGDETESTSERIKDCIDVIHDAKQRKVGIR